MSERETVPIFHLIYSSTATDRLNQTELLDLLRLSRRKNEGCGLTGMLLYRSGLYLQFLEGSPAEVNRLVERLRQDPRHTDIRILREGKLPQRLFPDWSMAFKNLSGLKTAQVPGYSEHLQGHFDQGGTDPARLLVRMFQEIPAIA